MVGLSRTDQRGCGPSSSARSAECSQAGNGRARRCRESSRRWPWPPQERWRLSAWRRAAAPRPARWRAVGAAGGRGGGGGAPRRAPAPRPRDPRAGAPSARRAAATSSRNRPRRGADRERAQPRSRGDSLTARKCGVERGAQTRAPRRPFHEKRSRSSLRRCARSASQLPTATAPSVHAHGRRRILCGRLVSTRESDKSRSARRSSRRWSSIPRSSRSRRA